MKKPWLAAILNFFFMGPGTLYNGRRKVVGVVLTLGALVLTYVEFNLKAAAPDLYPLMFVAVFMVNTVLAYDGFMEAKAINEGK
ncbi:MAG: hypothetical protein ABIJ39_08405 [Chloroflexota bacterium]